MLTAAVFLHVFFSLSIGCNFIPPKHALYRLVCCRGKLVSIRSSFLLFVFILSFFKFYHNWNKNFPVNIVVST